MGAPSKPGQQPAELGTARRTPTSSSFFSALPGSPADPFPARVNTCWADRDCLGECLTAVLFGAGACRGWALMPTAALVWVVAHCVACAGNAAWRSCALAGYVKWREVSVTLLRLSSLGLGLLALPMQHLLDDPAATSGGGSTADSTAGSSAAAHVSLAQPLLSSGAGALAFFAFLWRVRFSLSAAVQLAAMVLLVLPFNQRTCTATTLSSGSMRRAIHTLYQLVSGVSVVLPLPTPLQPPPDDVAECATVMTWSQVSLGLLVPLLWDALLHARQHHQHQQQRQEVGLPPDGGWEARLHSWVWSLSKAWSPYRLTLVHWVLLSMAWNWCALAVEVATMQGQR